MGAAVVCGAKSAGELWACVCTNTWREGLLSRRVGSVAGETPACRGAGEDAVLVSCFMSSAGLWHASLPAAGPKDDTDVTEEALV